MKHKFENLPLDHLLNLFQLFDWWYPQRLVEETDIKPDRIKYLIKQRKAFVAAGETNEKELNDEQSDLLEQFAFRQASYEGHTESYDGEIYESCPLR